MVNTPTPKVNNVSADREPKSYAAWEAKHFPKGKPQ
jgi:hypothetical protein